MLYLLRSCNFVSLSFIQNFTRNHVITYTNLAENILALPVCVLMGSPEVRTKSAAPNITRKYMTTQRRVLCGK